MIRIPLVGDKVRLSVEGGGDVDTTDQPNGDLKYVKVPAGEIWEVSDINYWPTTGQDIAFVLVHASGVVNIWDAGDRIDGCYPFEVIIEEG